MDYEKKEKIANRLMAGFMLLVILIFMIFQFSKRDDNSSGTPLPDVTPTAEATATPEK